MADLQPLNRAASHPVGARVDLAGSEPYFPHYAGDSLATSLPLADFRQKRLLFGSLTMPGQIHVYSAECRAGERLRVQMLAPVLAGGGALAPAFAVVAQSLPYSADVRKLPFELPAGFSAVVAPPPAELVTPVKDLLTGAHYFPGPLVDTRTLVGGRCYIVVWCPQPQMGKYALLIGHGWPLGWGYWLQLPRYWWQIRGWFGLSRAAAYATVAALLSLSLAGMALFRKRK
ncbi:MAG: hypothetical protein KJZ93_21050 [Caldilineaceae bacterium]|nr:hypothetical protein [Caldilineaceae bacterium]